MQIRTHRHLQDRKTISAYWNIRLLCSGGFRTCPIKPSVRRTAPAHRYPRHRAWSHWASERGIETQHKKETKAIDGCLLAQCGGCVRHHSVCVAIGATNTKLQTGSQHRTWRRWRHMRERALSCDLRCLPSWLWPNSHYIGGLRTVSTASVAYQARTPRQADGLIAPLPTAGDAP